MALRETRRETLTGMVVCPRCHHHTGNSHQGHYWAYCLVKRGSRDFHFCCPDPAFGCELEHAS